MLINRDNIGRSQKREHRMPRDPKPVLEMQRLPVFRVHYKALEAYVRLVFGFDFDYLFAAGVVEGCAVDYSINGQMPAALDRQATELRTGKRTKNVALILSVLVHDEYIPAGNYTVSTHQLPDPTAVYTQLLRQNLSPLHPDCLKFKDKHREDAGFMQRAAVLERALLEQLEK